MQQSLGKLNNSSAIPEILYPIVHNRVHKSLLLVPVSLQINPIHVFHFYILKIHATLSSQLNLGLPNGLFPSSYAISPASLLLCHTIILLLVSHKIRN
jgi:hypothetical protein